MSARTLDDLITDGGIRSTYFFNGRMLSGEDLRQEQDANRSGRRELGQAIGSGIAAGFEVTQQPANVNSAILTIAPGLAINPMGQAIQLNVRVDLSLLQPATQTTQGVAVFSDCQRPANGIYVATSGVYLLAVCPVAVKQGRAPASGLGNQTSPCNSDVVVDGLQFRLVAVPSSFLPALDILTRRNTIAWRCFGFGETPDSLLATPPLTVGLVDALRAATLLTDCDVPLAVFSWLDTAQIQDLDMWSVRRRITRPWPDSASRAVLGDVRASTAEASLLQFQSHLSDLIKAGASPATALRYLPSVGYLPSGSGGSNFATLLGPCVTGAITPMSQALYREIVANALLDDPIDLLNPVPVRVYQQDPDDGFVLYARTRDARLKITYAASVPASAVATLQSRTGNLAFTMQSGSAGAPLTADVPAGHYELTVSAPNLAPFESGDLPLVGGRITSLDGIFLSATPTGSLRIGIDPTIKPTANMTFVVSVNEVGGQAFAPARSGFVWTAPNLHPANYLVQMIVTVPFVFGIAFVPTVRVGSRTVTVAAGSPTVVTFTAKDFG